jgi:diguanylate cyclase (GGDEF)-like protein/PAS domain S-box-containing protein
VNRRKSDLNLGASEPVSPVALDRGRLLATLVNQIPALLGYWNSELRCEFANDGYRSWFGLSPLAVVGMHMSELMSADLFAATELPARQALQGHAQHFERTLYRADGQFSTLDVRYIPDADDTGYVRGFFVLATDITALRDVQHQLEALNTRLLRESETDCLTGLANRRVFNRHSRSAAAQFSAAGVSYGLILFDLDDFKSINDRYGHDGGDEVLQAFGRILLQETRSGHDFAARLGGEEFGVLCCGSMDDATLHRLAERIRARAAAEIVANASALIHFTTSAGVAKARGGDKKWNDIYSRADAALYAAKKSGKDRVVLDRLSECA